MADRRTALLSLALWAVSGCVPVREAFVPPQEIRVDCATAAVVGLHWSAHAPAAGGVRYRILRDGESLMSTAATSFADVTVRPSMTYRYAVSAVDRAGVAAVSPALDVTTAPPSPNGDAPYCASPVIQAMQWDWTHGYRAAEGSDLWPATWGADGRVYTFFGDGGGFGGDDHRGRASFGIARIAGPPPPAAGAAINVYGGYAARHPSRLSGKVRSIIAIGSDFYAIAGIYRPTDAKYREGQAISGAPEHVEIAYSLQNAHSWQDSSWSFCEGVNPAEGAATDGFCPSGFVNFGRGNAGAPDRYVYLFGSSPAMDLRTRDAPAAARSYLARVARDQILNPTAYRYFAGLDARGRPIWSDATLRMQPVFVDRNVPQPGCGGRCNMASTLEEAVYDAPLGRYIGIAQGELLAQTSFYEAPHPWGPWSTIAYQNIDAGSGAGGWGNLGVAAGDSLGVHAVNAWTSADGRTLWMIYSSDGHAPPGALFPPPGSALDGFHLLRVRLTLAGR